MERKVKKALKIMRKANTKPGRMELEMDKINKVKQMEDSGLLHNKEEPDVMRQLATGEMEMLYSDKEPIHLKTKADMKKAARENYAIASEMNRIHQMTSKLGKPRKIFVDLVQEIKTEEMMRIRKARESKIDELKVLEAEKRREDQIASTIAILRRTKEAKSEAADPASSSALSSALAKLAVNRRIISPPPAGCVAGDFNAQDELFERKPSEDIKDISPKRSESRTAGLTKTDAEISGNRTLKDSVGRIRPRTAGSMRSSSAAVAVGPLADGIRRVAMVQGSVTDSSKLSSLGELVSASEGSLMKIESTDRLAPLPSQPPRIQIPRPTSAGNGHRASAWGHTVVVESDNRLLKVLDIRKQIAEQKDEELRSKMLEKQAKLERRRGAKERRLLQQAYLIIVKAMFWIARSRENPRLTNMYADRTKRKYISQLASRTFAGIKLSRWWKSMKIRRKLLENPKVLYTLAYCVRYIWAKMMLKKRRTGSKLLLKFLKDAYDKSNLMKKIYGFRKACLKVQRWVKDYQRIQHARLQLLWLAMEVIEKRREEERHQEELKQMRISVKAMTKMVGFSETITEINKVKKQLNRVLVQEDRIMKKVRKEQQGADSMTEDCSFRFSQSIVSDPSELAGATSATNPSSMSSPWSKSAKNADLGGKNSKSAFVRKMMATRSNAHKLRLLREVLRAQRIRHLLTVDEIRNRGKKGTTVNLRGLKKFLHDPSSTTGVNDVLVGLPDENYRQSNKGVPRPIFLLLTKGGIAQLENIPSSVYQLNFTTNRLLRASAQDD